MTAGPRLTVPASRLGEFLQFVDGVLDHEDKTDRATRLLWPVVVMVLGVTMIVMFALTAVPWGAAVPGIVATAAGGGGIAAVRRRRRRILRPVVVPLPKSPEPHAGS